ncbi:MAG: DUF1801 domain-containing protein [Anaerolineales bacterium]|nr:DUF1801 domain-containing protein [Anaerolineales bacterium]
MSPGSFADSQAFRDATCSQFLSGHANKILVQCSKRRKRSRKRYSEGQEYGELKTKQNEGDVHAFLQSVDNHRRREDALKTLDLFTELIGEEPTMWGDSIVGFGSYHYKYASGREADWMLTGFSPRKKSLSLYIMSGFDASESFLEKLGKHRTGKACLYVNRLSDIDTDVLRELVHLCVKHMAAQSAV